MFEQNAKNKICCDDDQCILFTGGKNVKVFFFYKNKIVMCIIFESL